jgi:hypothetical protein
MEREGGGGMGRAITDRFTARRRGGGNHWEMPCRPIKKRPNLPVPTVAHSSSNQWQNQPTNGRGREGVSEGGRKEDGFDLRKGGDIMEVPDYLPELHIDELKMEWQSSSSSGQENNKDSSRDKPLICIFAV